MNAFSERRKETKIVIVDNYN